VRLKPLIDRAPAAWLLAMTVIWGYTFVVVQVAVARFGVIEFLVLRFAIATLALVPWSFREVRIHEWRIGLILGGTLSLGYLFQTWGLKHITVTESGFLTGLFVVFAPLWAAVLYRVRLGRRNIVALALSLVGLEFLLGGWDFHLTAGSLLTIGGALCFGLQIALLSRQGPSCRTGALTFTQMAAMTFWLALLLPAGAALQNPFHGPLVLALLLTGVLASAFAFYVQTRVQQRLSAARTAVILVTEPFFAALFGHWLNHDPLTGSLAVGAGLLVLAMLVSELGLGPFDRNRAIPGK
jgi:drug/metabolite transporter (DMT)-like permease